MSQVRLLDKLRHTTTTLLLNNGIAITNMSEHLGHYNIKVTAGTYTAILDSLRKKLLTLWSRF
ncbi:MAG TPA: hypothetical protein DCX98_04990 [Eubacterium sp.]|nr:hypothetical protein [Eubacterium sp.]